MKSINCFQVHLGRNTWCFVYVNSVDVFSKLCSLNNKKGSWEKTIYLSPLTLLEYWKLLVPAGLAIFERVWSDGPPVWDLPRRPPPLGLPGSDGVFSTPCSLGILCSRASRRLRPWAQERNCSCLRGRRRREKRREEGKENLCFGEDGIYS